MGLQYGSEKCVKMHIGKNHHKVICTDLEVDCWKEERVEEKDDQKYMMEKYTGKEVMQLVSEKKYLGDIISSDGKNNKNIIERTNKAMGNVNKIVSTLNERPYGKHLFKAYQLMREGLLLGGLLTNVESWINITKQNLDDLEKPDTILQRKLLSVTANPSKCFMKLELAILPVKYVIMKKRLMFLQYILKESTESLISQVFTALKEDSRKGDFVQLTNTDRKDLEIELNDMEIKSMSKWSWKKLLKEKTKVMAFVELEQENSEKEKTRDIEFDSLEMSSYLKENERTSTNISNKISNT
jgi:hypothetical protein